MHGFRVLGLRVAQPGAALDDTLELAVRAERAGFRLFGVGDAANDAFAVLGALAARTRHAELHASIATWTRTPVTTARAAATVAELAGGRFRLGIGTMPPQWSSDHHDVDPARPLARMRDYVAAVRAAMAASVDAPGSHAGAYYRFQAYVPVRGVPTPTVPVDLAATRPGMARLAGEIADGVMLNHQHSLRYLRDVVFPALEDGLARANRTRSDIDIGALVLCSIADSWAEAADLVRRTLAFYLVTPYLHQLLAYHRFDDELERAAAAHDRGDLVGAAAAISDRVVRTIALAGTADEVRDGLRRYEGLVDWVDLTPPSGHPPDVLRTQAERIIATFGSDASG
jgi:alkanesulfonate monooxygenase SsuD/methylene tetrahydromethanopterin reductase-like flavin-dependent oxidoreductase (luciferase family)